VLTQVGDEFAAVPTGAAAAKFRGIIRLNETAADIYRGIEAGKSVREIAEALVEKYDGVDIEAAEKSACTVIGELKSTGLAQD